MIGSSKTANMYLQANGWDPAKFDNTMAELHRFEQLVREDERRRLAEKIAQMPFGDTAASFAAWVREQK